MHHHYPGAGSANGSAVDASQSLTLPPSPTLTNPDMILPYETERETSTPSPPFQPLQLPSPPDFRHLQDRDHGQGHEHGKSLHTQSSDRHQDRDRDRDVVSDRATDESEIGMAVSFPARQDNKRPSPPRNLWALGGHQVGPPLSDIGEEDSVSSPPQSTSSWHEGNSSFGNESPVLASSPNIESHWNRGGGRGGEEEECDGWSDDSSSTVSAHSNNGRWDGFDGSNVQRNGDLHSHTDQTTPRESPRDPAYSSDEYGHYQRNGEEHVNEEYESGGFGRGEEENTIGSIPEEKGEEENMDEISSSMLSNEAERILENAKKRLTFMEGNLSRARTSIRMSPSPSPSSPVNTGFALGAPQPVGGLYRSISQLDRRVQTGQAGSRLRLNRTSALSREMNNNQAHARGSSETHLPSTLQSTLPAPENKHVFRSMSAMGSTGSSLHFGDNDNSHYARSSSHSRTLGSFSYQHQPLDALQEDDGQQQFQPQEQQRYQQSGNSTPEIHPGSSNSSQNGVPKISTTEEFNSAYPANSPPSRTHSQLHVRDLQDQMKGLKTKLSSLKVRTEEDSLRRRSLQSLRTPSPFTAAEQWYTGAVEYRDGGNSLNSNAGYGFSPQHAPGGFGEERGRTVEGPESPRKILENRQNSRHSPEAESIMESHYEDAEENYYDDGEPDSPLKEADRAALDEILNESEDESLYDEFHEASADASEPTRHEDREDAFDYEHFFLHSALGNYYSRSKGRRESYSSTASAETTKAAERPESYSSAAASQAANNRLSKSHARNPSTDSVSTVATFATATEGVDSGDDEDSEGEIDNALNWNGNGNGHSYSGSQTWRTHNNYAPSSHAKKVSNGSRDAYPDSESSTSSAAETETGISTPRAQRLSQNVEDDVGLRPNRLTQILSPPANGNGHSRPTSSLVSSLVSSVSPSPSRAKTPGGSSTTQLNNDDTMALEQLFKSLGKVCLELQESTESTGASEADIRSVTILRRRLDAARRVLDGELDP
ncbi:hypothetical protein FQN54_001397 [Arachnomyces sp. PD_36]|nr:hypothetical protein FQN54_001397 [Arachnomyces sp. PD_36]